MDLFLRIFLENVLPTFLVIGAGVLLDRKLNVDKRSVSRLAIYILGPCLIFSSISQSTVDPTQFGRMILFVILITIALCLIGLAVGKLLGWAPRTVDALVLSIAFLNAGNFGLPIILFSFGEMGFEYGMAFFVVSNLTCNTIAAFFAARGNGGTLKALKRVLRLPQPYIFIAAYGIRLLGWTVPDLLLKPTALIGRAAVPIMLLLLGIQLSQTQLGRRYGQVAVGVFLRLIVGTLLGIGLAPLLGLSGLARQVAITEAATPTAVSSSLMAVEFDADAEYVTSVIFFSTLLSSITLTVLIALLKS